MAEQETKIFVDLDTAKAMVELDRLEGQASQVSERMGARIKSALGTGLSAVGLGGAFAVGAATIRGATESGVGDVVGEAFGGIGKQIEEFFLGNLNEQARAAASARNETMEVFQLVAGARNAIPEGAHQYFTSLEQIHMHKERGRELFEMDERFRGPGINEIIDHVATRLGQLLSDAVDYLYDKMVGG